MGVDTSAITNLLRFARSECRADVAFALLSADGGECALHRVPSEEAAATPSYEALLQITTQVARDPEFGRAKTFVRTVQLAAATVVAVAPVRGGGPRDMLGVLAENPDGFAPAQLDLLDRLAERIARHVRAVHALATATVGGGGGAAEEQMDGADATLAGALRAGPPGLGFVGFGDEPGGAIAPAPPGTPDAEPWQRQPLGPQTGTIAGGLLRPPSPHDALAVPSNALRAGHAPGPEEAVPPSPGSWWTATDPLTGLPGLGQFFSRAGRLLGSEARASGAVALVLVEVPDEHTAAAAARALAAQLRFSDPLARVDRDVFAAAVLLFPGSVRGDAVEERLGAAVRAALDWLAPVRTTHVLAEPGDRRDVDELLRQALAGLPGRNLSRSL